jgi:hypothetical protein
VVELRYIASRALGYKGVRLVRLGIDGGSVGVGTCRRRRHAVRAPPLVRVHFPEIFTACLGVRRSARSGSVHDFRIRMLGNS